MKAKIKEYVPTPALILFAFAFISGAVHIISEFSKPFSDFVNRYIGSLFRGILAVVTGILPFSLAEAVILFIPVIFTVIIVFCVKRTNRSVRDGVRYVVSMAAVLSLLYSLFVFTTVVGYNGTPLSGKLSLDEAPVSVDELREAAEYMRDKTNEQLGQIEYIYGKSSVMPYSITDMNKLLLEAFDKVSDEYDFLPRLYSRIKPIALSEPMTYTHISGLYSYYTGEANVNVNFPDYTLPFTAAHELAHQRGILPENEANFVAFLACIASEDPYIRYSGYLNMYEYLNSALYSANYDVFAEVYSSLDIRVHGEISAYNKFFEKYRDNVAADISSTMNDNYLKSQGVEGGEKSYGMVVDLAIAWVNAIEE